MWRSRPVSCEAASGGRAGAVPPGARAGAVPPGALGGRLRVARGVLPLGALGLGLWAQRLLDGGSHAAGVLAYVAAAALLVGSSGDAGTEGAVGQAETSAPFPWRHVCAAALLAGLGFGRFAGNRFRPDGTLLWIAALVVLGSACVGRPSDAARAVGRWALSLRGGLRLCPWALGLVGIGALAALLRFHRIAEIPLEMGCDVPHVYQGVREILEGGWPIYFPSHPGREGLFHYLTAPLALVAGLSHTTLKVSSGLVGLATLPALYALGRELHGRATGLAAAFFLAVSHWHLILSRRGLRAITMPLFVALAWLCLARGLRTGRRGAFFLCGLALGLGMYTYNAFLVVPGLVVLILAGEALTGRPERVRRNLPNVAFALAVMAAACVPLGRYAYEEPQQYLFRVATRLTEAERPVPTDLVSTLLGNLWRTALMFNVRGDIVYAANVPHLRELGPVSAALFVLGVALAVWRWRRGHHLAVLLGLGVLLAPSALSVAFPNEVPSATRAVGALVPAVLLVAVALVEVVRSVARWTRALAPHPGALGALGVGVAGLLAWEAWSVFPTYFHDFRLAQPRSNYSISLDMARTIDAFGGEAYIVVWPHWYDGNAVRAEFRRTPQDWHNEVMDLAAEGGPLAGPGGPVLVLVHEDDADSLRTLREAFPGGVTVTHYDYDGYVSFIAFYGER